MNHPLADSSLGFQMVMPFMFWRVVFLGVSFLYLTGFKVAQNTADVIRKNGGGCSWLGLPDSLEDTGVLDLLVPQSSSTKRPFFFFSPMFMIPRPLLPSIFSSTLILGWFELGTRGSWLGGGGGYQGHSQPASRNWTELRPNLHKVQSLRPFLCWRRMIGTVCAPIPLCTSPFPVAS